MGVLPDRLANWWIWSPRKSEGDDLHPRQASLCFLSFPSPEIVLNVQVEGKLLRFEITREQLAGLIKTGICKVI